MLLPAHSWAPGVRDGEIHPRGLVVGGTELCPGDKGQSCLVVTGLGVTAGRTWDRISGSSV